MPVLVETLSCLIQQESISCSGRVLATIIGYAIISEAFDTRLSLQGACWSNYWAADLEFERRYTHQGEHLPLVA